MKLSILICTLPKPYRDIIYISRLAEKLVNQIRGRNVQVIYLGDNKSMSVGEKRNELLRMAKGERIIFIDDDDQITDNYVDKLLEYCELDYDCISIGVRFTRNGENDATYDYNYKQNINFRDTTNGGKRMHGRMPNHLCLWKKEVAQRVKFPEQNLGEDHIWAEKQILLEYSFHDTKEVLYHYDFKDKNTQTRIR